MSDNEFSFYLRWGTTRGGSCAIRFQADQSEFEAVVGIATHYITLNIFCLSNQILLHNCKKCIIETPDGTSIGEYEVQHKVVGRYDIVGQIPRERLKVEDQQYSINIRLIVSNYDKALSPEAMYTSPLIEKLFREKSTTDITFRFDGFSETVAAHKLILSQCNYFRTMFESEFTEGGPGPKEVTVQEVKPADFELMIKFLYLGTRDVTVATLYSEDSSTNTTSWEGIYIAADRYQIDDLCKFVLGVFEKKLGDSLAEIDFLFRTARLYPELRTCVIKHIAKELRDQFLKKEVRDKYILLPEYSEILGELYEETFRALNLK